MAARDRRSNTCWTCPPNVSHLQGMSRAAMALLACLSLAGLAEAGTAEVRKGAFEVVFSERWPESSVQSIFQRMQHEPRTTPSPGDNYRIDEETYAVYVPSGYTAETAYGLLVWVSAGERGDMPKGWQALMDRHKLIWIGAHRSGNRHNLPKRRIPLALDAVFNMRKKYNIDPDRIYVSGISGGGRVASFLAMHYPDVFSGGIFVVGVEYWEPLPVTGAPGQIWKPMPRPQVKYLALARERGRYVLLTGDHDGNRRQTQDYYENGYKKQLKHVFYIQVPDMGHEMPPMEWYEKAIAFLDTPKAADAQDGP
jgi:pimeloyl-ACP methyl ester carboxylesterase